MAARSTTEMPRGQRGGLQGHKNGTVISLCDHTYLRQQRDL